ncbi:MAG: recombination protein RecR [Kiritimatiellae bacterium]|nr:recombination protein RecR [Kiritimatiellia bacterium]
MEALEKLIVCLGKLPGIGRRSAERMATRLVREPDGLMRDLMAALHAARQHIQVCRCCGALTNDEQQPCRFCTNPSRDDTVLCVVEDPNDVAGIERSGAFNGRYHVLMGKLSPMKGEGLRHLRMQALLDRLDKEPVKEIILATSTDVEGDATASYVAEQLAARNVSISRLAFGLPVSSGIAYSDPVTLQRAIRGRNTY